MQKKILLFTIAIIFFSYGFGSHKFQIFPYKILVELKNFINKDKNQLKISNDKLKKIIENQDKIRKEYPQWSQKIRLIKYSPGLNIFSDRNYYNHLNDSFLEKKYLLQIPRHYNRKIKILFLKNAVVFRIICNSNKNNLDGWKKSRENIMIISSTCVHKEIYKRKFIKGKYVFEHGGPISADPIFLEISNPSDIKIIN